MTLSAGHGTADVDTARPRWAPPDAVAGLSVFVLLLVAIPSRLIVGPLGGAGTPAQVTGMVLAAWWVVSVLVVRRQGAGRARGLRIAVLVWGAALLASYVAATSGPIQADELRSADLGLLAFVSWFGIMAAAMDGIPNRERLETLLRRLAFAGGALALVGLAQFVTKSPLVDVIQVPGLTSNSPLVSVYGRDGLTRPAGTALHPIEFGAVLTMILPVALHLAMHDTTRAVWRRWYPVAAIALAVPISISRSAIVSTVVVLCVVLPTFPRATRRRAYLALVVVVGVLYVLVPGLLGTVTGLFTGISNDSSAQSRTDSYGIAEQFIGRAPLFGRGFRTFLPAYRILDNQYLGTLIEIGVVGTLALVCLYGTGVVAGLRLRRRLVDPAARSLAAALAAGVASAAVSFALFDAFSFPMAANLVFLLLGCIGAAQRVLGAPAVARGRAGVKNRVN